MSETADHSAPPDLTTLIGHHESVGAGETLEAVQQRFATSRQDFMAVTDGAALLGLCARRDIGTLLGARFGFALYARAPVRAHLSAEMIVVRRTQGLTEILPMVAARQDEHFYDDVLLIGDEGELLGLIFVRELVRLQTALLLDNIDELRRRQEEIAEKNRQMENDLRMAREVQLAMLPLECPVCTGDNGRQLTFAHIYQPAGGVGGDFFDLVELGGGRTGVIVCDVMGHGVRSALITAMVRAMIEELRPQAGDPGHLLTQLNALLTRLLQRTGDMIFVTAAYGVLDANTGRLTYAQAGHPAPLRWSPAENHVGPLPNAEAIGGPALGLLGDQVFESMTVTLTPGDRVLFFTDGISEAAKPDGEEFGVTRLGQTLQAQAPLRETLAQVLQATSAFSGAESFSDDVCLVLCEYA